jgi:hypothetical protein
MPGAPGRRRSFGSRPTTPGSRRAAGGRTLDGDALPLSGSPRFGNSLNALFTTMQSHEGSLYAGTLIRASSQSFLSWRRSSSTRSGSTCCVANRASTGTRSRETASKLRAVRRSEPGVDSATVRRHRAGIDGAQVWLKSPRPRADRPRGPLPAEAASELITDDPDDVILSWEPVPDAVVYHVYRSTVTPPTDARELRLGAGALLPCPSISDGTPMLCDNVPALCALLDVIVNQTGHPGPFS